MNKKLVFSIFVIAVLFSAAASYSNVPGGRSFSGSGIGSQLNLTNDQKAKISEKEKSMDRETNQLRQTMRDIRNQINDEVASDNPDMTKINALIDGSTKNMSDMQKNQISFMLWMKDQLTPEQKQKFISIMKSWSHPNPGNGEAEKK